tara:strand:- start:249 stop:488 length:240 start_codon:yes stop_codon:yes gene_type:complete
VALEAQDIQLLLLLEDLEVVVLKEIVVDLILDLQEQLDKVIVVEMEYFVAQLETLTVPAAAAVVLEYLVVMALQAVEYQ